MKRSVLFLPLVLIFLKGSSGYSQQYESLRIAHRDSNRIEIISYDSVNKKTDLYSSRQLDTLPVCTKGDFIFFNSPGLSVYNLKTKTYTPLNEKGISYEVGGFFKKHDWVYYTRQLKKTVAPEVVVYDYANQKVIKVLQGFGPKISPTKDLLFYLTPEEEPIIDSVGYYVYIMKYAADAERSTKIDSIVLNEGKFDITELAIRSDSELCYRVYDEHEYRYYYKDQGKEKMFYDGGKTHTINGESKEQYGLTFSSDGAYATFTERNWNELTYLVVIDLRKKERIETSFSGSFPQIVNERVYFISDPEFVESKNQPFRQIKNYALYYFDLKSKKLVLVRKFEGGILILHE